MKDKTYFLIFLIACIILIIGIIITIILLLTEDKPSEEDWNQYNCYIFSIFWPASSCFNKDYGNQECFDRVRELGIDDYYIIHGLWPTYRSGKYTDICNKNSEINITFNNEEYLKNLTEYWPGLYSSDQTMWNHEYNKHGYCYIKRIKKNPNVDYEIYFNKTIELFNNSRFLMEDILPDTPKGLHNVTKTKFKQFLLESKQKINSSTYSLLCTRNDTKKTDVLNEIRFNYDMNFKLISDIKSSENCPENFQIYFSDEKKKPVYEKFEFYVLTALWNPSSCRQRGKECYKKVKEKELNILMIHGLWPSYWTGKFPQWCNIGEDVEILEFEGDLNKTMNDYWLGVYETNKIFWEHEYNKHGYCYNQRYGYDVNNYAEYFQKTVDLYFKYNLTHLLTEFYPDILPGIRNLSQVEMAEKLEEKYGKGNFAISCFGYEGQYWLYEIRLKLDIDFQLTNKGKTNDNCPVFFNAEFLEAEEGPQKQAEGFYETYDMYFFTILWLGTTCHMKGKYCYENIKKVPKNKFTLHGLWPNYRNGTLADWCNGKNNIEIEIHDPDLSEFMETYYVSGYHTNPYFWGHEYNKHGYCYNQRNNINVTDYEIYFKKVKELFLKYDFENIFINMYKDKIVPGDMIINRKEVEEYLDSKGISRDKYVIVCTNITQINETEFNPHLLEIRVRFDLTFELLKNETDVSEFDCPELFYAQFL